MVVGKETHLEQVAPTRFVNVREGRGALEGEGTADGVRVRVVQLRCGFAEGLRLQMQIWPVMRLVQLLKRTMLSQHQSVKYFCRVYT